MVVGLRRGGTIRPVCQRRCEKKKRERDARSRREWRHLHRAHEQIDVAGGGERQHVTETWEAVRREAARAEDGWHLRGIPDTIVGLELVCATEMSFKIFIPFGVSFDRVSLSRFQKELVKKKGRNSAAGCTNCN